MKNKKYDVTIEDIENALVQEIYIQAGFKTTICVLIANTGNEAVGSYSPIDPELFDIGIGKKVAREVAFIKTREHLNSITQWQLAVEKSKEEEKKLQEETENSKTN